MVSLRVDRLDKGSGTTAGKGAACLWIIRGAAPGAWRRNLTATARACPMSFCLPCSACKEQVGKSNVQNRFVVECCAAAVRLCRGRAKASAELAMKAGDRLGGAAAPFQCACGTFLGGVFGNVLPHGRVVRRMGVLVSAWVWRWARVYHIWLSLCTRTWPVQACLLSFPSFCRLLSQVRCCSVVGVTGGAAMLASSPKCC